MVEYENTEDVTRQFYILSNVGMVVLLLCALMYYLQGKEGMHSVMRPYVMLVNICALAWFVTL